MNPISGINQKSINEQIKNASTAQDLRKILQNAPLLELDKVEVEYTNINPETGKLDFQRGYFFADEYIRTSSKTKNGILSAADVPVGGNIIDLNNDGRISPGEKLSHLIFQDSTEELNGKVSYIKADKAAKIMLNNPAWSKDRLLKIYNGLKINELEQKMKIFTLYREFLLFIGKSRNNPERE